MLSIGRCHVLRWFPRVYIAFDLPQLMCDRLVFYLFTFLWCVFSFPSSPRRSRWGVLSFHIIYCALAIASALVCCMFDMRDENEDEEKGASRDNPLFVFLGLPCVALLDWRHFPTALYTPLSVVDDGFFSGIAIDHWVVFYMLLFFFFFPFFFLGYQTNELAAIGLKTALYSCRSNVRCQSTSRHSSQPLLSSFSSSSPHHARPVLRTPLHRFDSQTEVSTNALTIAGLIFTAPLWLQRMPSTVRYVRCTPYLHFLARS